MFSLWRLIKSNAYCKNDFFLHYTCTALGTNLFISHLAERYYYNKHSNTDWTILRRIYTSESALSS